MRASARKYAAAGFCYEDIVFDSDAESAGDVYAWLDGDDLAGLELLFGVGL